VNYLDVTSLLPGARNQETAALQELVKKFAQGRFYLPLATTREVRNSPDAVVERGAGLPVHLLSLAEGGRCGGFFTNRHAVKLAEKELSWKTDGRALMCLSVPGHVMASFAEALFDAGTIERVILNPCDPNEIHFSQGDLAALRKGEVPGISVSKKSKCTRHRSHWSAG
jgi:hypothetical protein